MSNMSYCRFENTLQDLEDCYEALQELSNLNELSESERQAAKRLISISEKIAGLEINSVPSNQSRTESQRT